MVMFVSSVTSVLSVKIVIMPPQNNFDFIVNPTQPKRSGPSFLQNPKQRMIAVVLFVAVILTLVVVGFSIISSAGKQSTDNLVTLAAYQTEIVRISDLALKDVSDPAAQTKLTTISTFMKSDLASTLSFLSSQGVKPKAELLNAKKDSTADTAITNAKQANNLNTEIDTIINDKLSDYANLLAPESESAKALALKETLDRAVQNILLYDSSNNPN